MSDLEKRVLDEIARRRIQPRPAFVFLARRSVFWTLAGLSLFMGALSFALLFFVIADYFATGLRTLDNMPLDEFLAGVPLLWLAALAVFLTSASFGVRLTRRGYRFPLRRLVLASLLSSLALGGILHVGGAGRTAHEWLELRSPAYKRYFHVPFAEWSRPDAGRLGGTVLVVEDGKTFTLRDFNDVVWTIDHAMADVEVDGPLAEEGDVAIVGTRTGAASFRAETIREFD